MSTVETGFCPSKPADRAIDELDAQISALSRHVHAETYRLLMLVREFDDRFGWARWSFGSCAEWLAWRCQLSLSAAREKVRTAQALRRLPAISSAFAEGRLSYSKVRALTRVARPQDEDLLLAYALGATAAQVEDRCRQMRNLSPEAAGQARRVWDRRSLTALRQPERGIMRITVELPIEDGEVIVRAIERSVAERQVAGGTDYVAAHGMAAGDGVADREPAVGGWRAQQADALVAVARAYLGGQAAGSTSVADHYQVVLRVDAKALRGGAGRADLPWPVIERITCDGSLIPLVEGEFGSPVALGRKHRVVSPALRRALWLRDGGCTFPGCHRTHYVDAHHIEHWAKGGETTLANLALLCSYHHRLLHEGRFTVQRLRDSTLEFLRADGRVIPSSGYRLEDMVDDGIDDVGPDGLEAESEGQAPSTEVRETPPMYEVKAPAPRRHTVNQRVAGALRQKNSPAWPGWSPLPIN